jgi:5'-3' exonuclease
VNCAADPEVEQVVICTTDKDLAQVVEGDRVVLSDRIRKVVTDEDGVVAKFGVPPRLIPDWLGLVGDAADGLPGLPGWGPKSAAAVLNRFGPVEEIPLDAAEWDVAVRGAARLAEMLAERRREAILYRDLATLRLDVPIRDTVADLEWRGAHREALTALADLLGAEETLGRVPRWREAETA